MFVIAIDGLMLIYISSRWKKCPIRLKASMSLSRLEPTSLAAWGRCENRLQKGDVSDTNRKENADPSKYDIRRWVCLKVDIRIEILHEEIS
jgi:hypothetical protein